ncbi:oligosaccharide flippase family protein [Modestobacter versicolor]|uniref:oligosaccharide flippase family protein n=1 Tax=Modestobacter versicolor TaxID=429133 RepID=UPI0034E043B9
MPEVTPGRRSELRTTLLFFAAAALVALSPLLYLSLVARTLGAAGFSDLAIGQSVGAAAAVVVGLGWAFTGPVAVAGASAAERPRILARALATQVWVAAALTVPAVALVWALAGTYPVGAALGAVATMLIGVTPIWYFIGLGRGTWNVVFDALPKVASALVGGVLVVVTEQLWPLPLCQAAASAVSYVLLVRRAGVTGLRAALAPREVRAVLRDQTSFSVAQVASTVYLNLPVTILAATGAAGVATFAAADRVMRLAVAGSLPVTQSFQSWVARGAGDLRRIRTSLVAHTALGLAGGVVLVSALPWLQSLLFDDRVRIGTPVVLLFAGVFLVGMLTRAIGVVALPALGDRSAVRVSACVGALVAVPAMVVLGREHGAAGGAAGVLLAEVTVLAVQAVALLRRTAAARRSGPAVSQVP